MTQLTLRERKKMCEEKEGAGDRRKRKRALNRQTHTHQKQLMKYWEDEQVLQELFLCVKLVHIVCTEFRGPLYKPDGS